MKYLRIKDKRFDYAKKKKKRERAKTRFFIKIKKIKQKILNNTQLSELIYEIKPLGGSRQGIFLVSHKDRILIQIFPNNLEKNKEYIQKLCVKKRYEYFSFKIFDSPNETISKINEFIYSFDNFILKRADELNDNLPKSEKWFADKIKQEYFYQWFKFKHNAPYKKYIYDLLSTKYNVVIEVDGSIHDNIDQITRDIEKDTQTKRYGFKVIRVKAFDDTSYTDCINQLKEILNSKNNYNPSPKSILRKQKKEEFKEAINEIDFKKKMPF